MNNITKVGRASMLFIGTGFLLTGFVCGENAPPGGIIDVAKPDTWEGSVSEAKDRLSRVAKDLILVAKDEKSMTLDRARAISLLGKIGNKESLDFLVSNTSLTLPLHTGSSAEGQLKQTPCLYALYKAGRNWAVAQAILESFSRPKPEREVGDLGKTFVYIMGPTPASGIVAQELGEKPTPEREKNLLYLKRVIEGR